MGESAFKAEQSETVIFDDIGVRVTNARFIVPSQTFAIAGITSVSFKQIPASTTGGVACLLLGLVCLLVNLFIGAFLIVAAIWLFNREKTKYAVVLRTSGGEVTGYEHTSKDLVQQIIDALNKAIILRA